MKHILLAIITIMTIGGNGIILGAVEPINYYSFIKELNNQQEKDTREFIINEIENYIHLFPFNNHVPELMLIMGDAHEKIGHKDIYFACALKNIFLFPQSSFTAESKSIILKFVGNDKEYNEKSSLWFDLLQKTNTDTIKSDGYYKYLQLLYKVQHSDLYEWTIKECDRFMLLFPKDNRNEQLIILEADLFRKNKDYKFADASFMKYLTLFPGGELEPFCLYNQGVVQANDLKNLEKSLAILGSLLEKFPKSEFAPQGLFFSAEVKQQKLKDYAGAVADYQLLLDQYEDYPENISALWQTALIYKNELNNPENAITTFELLLKKYSGHLKGIEALEQIAEINKKNKKFTETALALMRIAEYYPDYDKAAARLYEAAEVYEKQLNDLDKARSIYKLVTQKYPNTRQSDAAEKRIMKINELLSSSPLETQAKQ